MNRRTLLGAAACAAAAGFATPSLPRFALASEGRQLVIANRTIEVNGKSATVYGLTGPDGKPGLTLDVGSMFDVVLDNRLAEDTMIHWHGLTPPDTYDGVPGLPKPLLRPANSAPTVSRWERGARTGCTHTHCRSRPCWQRL